MATTYRETYIHVFSKPIIMLQVLSCRLYYIIAVHIIYWLQTVVYVPKVVIDLYLKASNYVSIFWPHIPIYSHTIWNSHSLHVYMIGGGGVGSLTIDIYILYHLYCYLPQVNIIYYIWVGVNVPLKWAIIHPF